MEKNETPHALGYRMPAEWERHEATWISWPKNPDSFPDSILPGVEKTYVQIAGALHKGETVNILVDSQGYEERAKKMLDAGGVSGNIAFHRIPTADVWFRDYGPIFVKRDSHPRIAASHWKFNAWGGKYEKLVQDVGVAARMPLPGTRIFEAPMVLEGGSIDVNGLGTCLTTEQCLLNRNRNPQLTREQICSYLSDYLGVSNVVWLKEGIAGDDTDGHVDDMARFVCKDTVVCAAEESKGDENYGALHENLKVLEDARDQDGRKLRVIRLPMPGEVSYGGHRLPASYSNFYIGNEAVLVPVFGDENDGRAMRLLESLFPGRKVVGINCRALVYGFGAIHCVTQQQPAPD